MQRALLSILIISIAILTSVLPVSIAMNVPPPGGGGGTITYYERIHVTNTSGISFPDNYLPLLFNTTMPKNTQISAWTGTHLNSPQYRNDWLNPNLVVNCSNGELLVCAITDIPSNYIVFNGTSVPFLEVLFTPCFNNGADILISYGQTYHDLYCWFNGINYGYGIFAYITYQNGQYHLIGVLDGDVFLDADIGTLSAHQHYAIGFYYNSSNGIVVFTWGNSTADYAYQFIPTNPSLYYHLDTYTNNVIIKVQDNGLYSPYIGINGYFIPS
jgi:hypothetical protein